jgi:pyrroline-5-carboxylate reductase
MTPRTIGFIGGGNMARSMIGGLIADGHPASHIWVAEPLPELRSALSIEFAIHTSDHNAQVAKTVDALIIAVKPQMAKSVCAALSATLATCKPTIISIAAGIRISQLEHWLGSHLPIIRAMPNTPALIKKGVTGAVKNQAVTDAEQAIASTILRAIGALVWVPNETLMDLVTAVSGSGPAYFFSMIEAMENAAVELGLSKEAAHTLVVQTAIGAAHMAQQSDESPSQLRQRVTSPGGTTEAALNELNAHGFHALIARAIEKARNRGQTLAQELGE